MTFDVTKYAFRPPYWTDGLRLRVVVLADIHASRPWMTIRRIRELVEQANSLKPDVMLLLGDYGHAALFFGRSVAHAHYAAELARLSAPLGIHAVLGNHDWRDDPLAQRRGAGPTACGDALAAAGISVYENESAQLEVDGKRFWIAGLGDQRAFRVPGASRLARFRGVHDLRAALAAITDDAPVILMAHEPDIFPEIPHRISLTLSGHTHGGQISLFGWTPVVPRTMGAVMCMATLSKTAAI